MHNHTQMFAHCTLHIAHCTLHIAHCTLHIAQANELGNALVQARHAQERRPRGKSGQHSLEMFQPKKVNSWQICSGKTLKQILLASILHLFWTKKCKKMCRQMTPFLTRFVPGRLSLRRNLNMCKHLHLRLHMRMQRSYPGGLSLLVIKSHTDAQSLLLHNCAMHNREKHIL